MTLISIVIPVYNTEQYLRQCLDSVVNQTYKNLEILLIDDGSTDSSGKICDEYASKDNRIKVIHKKNEGVSSARNDGLDIAKGDYIGFVDSDDYIDNNTYKKALNCLIKYNTDWCKWNCDRKVNCMNEGVIKGDEYQDLVIKSIAKRILGPSANFQLYKRKIIMDNNIYFPTNIKNNEDLCFVLNYALHTKNIYYLKNSFFYHYVFNIKSAIHTYNKDFYKEYLKVISYIEKLFINFKNNRYKKYINQKIHMSCFHIILHEMKNCNSNIKNKLQYLKYILNIEKFKHAIKNISLTNTNMKLFFCLIPLKYNLYIVSYFNIFVYLYLIKVTKKTLKFLR